MLQAKSEDGQLIIPAQLMPKELDKLRRKRFFCPACHERVILKAGPRVTPHFAHYAKSSCSVKQIGEGPYHTEGKLLLYHWLKKQYPTVQLERYIPNIQQRPDIFLEVNHKKVAIEFQCSRISPKILQQRNIGYQKINIEPIWILGKNLLKRYSTNCFKIDFFTKQFIHQFSANYPLTLFYFCPITKKIIQLQHIYLLKQSLAFAQLTQKPLSQMNFHHLFKKQSFHKRAFFRQLYQQKRNFRIYPFKPYGLTRKWYDWLYRRQTHIQYLPPHVYLPILSQIYMKTPLWDWQSRLCIDFIQPTPIEGKINFSMMNKSFATMKNPRNAFPLLKYLSDPLYSYLKLLEDFNIVKQVDRQTFLKTNSFNFPNHVEKALVKDRQLLAKWYKKYKITYETEKD